jgi:hypothetical protein
LAALPAQAFKIKLAPHCTLDGHIFWQRSVDTGSYTVNIGATSVDPTLCTVGTEYETGFRAATVYLRALNLVGTAVKLGACGGGRGGPVTGFIFSGSAFVVSSSGVKSTTTAQTNYGSARNSLDWTLKLTVSVPPNTLSYYKATFNVNAFAWQLYDGCPSNNQASIALDWY